MKLIGWWHKWEQFSCVVSFAGLLIAFRPNRMALVKVIPALSWNKWTQRAPPLCPGGFVSLPEDPVVGVCDVRRVLLGGPGESGGPGTAQTSRPLWTRRRNANTTRWKISQLCSVTSNSYLFTIRRKYMFRFHSQQLGGSIKIHSLNVNVLDN